MKGSLKYRSSSLNTDAALEQISNELLAECKVCDETSILSQTLRDKLER